LLDLRHYGTYHRIARQYSCGSSSADADRRGDGNIYVERNLLSVNKRYPFLQ
jgi:hypothetical protein